MPAVLSVLETERLVLRVPAEGDVPAWTELLTDPEVARYLGPPLRDARAVADNIRVVRERHAVDGFGLLALERKSDGRVIGRSGFLVWDRRLWAPSTLREAGPFAEVEIGWTLAPDCWGEGYATEAGRACLEAGFEVLGCDRIAALIQRENERSIAVARRLGMEHDEEIRTLRGIEAGLWVAERP